MVLIEAFAVQIRTSLDMLPMVEDPVHDEFTEDEQPIRISVWIHTELRR